MGRVISIDYGRSRIGIAITDPMKMIASPQDAIRAGKKTTDSAKIIAEYFKRWTDIEMVVVGLPLHMSGDESDMSKEVRLFCEKLEDLTNLPITLFDERLSSSGAEKFLKGHGLKRKQRAGLSDSIAAADLLRSFLSIH